VSIFPFREPAEGSSASCNFGLRRLGRLVVKGCACADGTEDDDDADTAAAAAGAGAGAGSSVDGVGVPEPLSCGTAASIWPSGGFQRGHFFASAESSGTSTISLSLRSQRLKPERSKKVGNRNGTHTTSSPANRCCFTILTIRFSDSLSGRSVDGALTDSWNLAHNACRSLQLLRHFLHRKTYHTSLQQLSLPG
jgi:hypothetical protein